MTGKVARISDRSAEKVERRDAIHRLEEAMLEMPQLEIETTHYLADGLYAREIFIPAGTTLTGKIHRREHLNVISMGKIDVVTEDGVKTVTAPCTMVSRPGTKRAGYAHEDTIWTTIHATENTDLNAIEEELITEDYSLIESDGPERLESKEDEP